jgi:hypothetical protein
MEERIQATVIEGRKEGRKEGKGRKEREGRKLAEFRKQHHSHRTDAGNRRPNFGFEFVLGGASLKYNGYKREQL